MNYCNKFAIVVLFMCTNTSFSMYSSLISKITGTANKTTPCAGIKKTFVLSKEEHYPSALQDVKNKLVQKQVAARDAKHFAESFEYIDAQKPKLVDRIDKMASRTLILGIIYILIGR